MEKVKNEINGWLVIDKPYGMGSTEVVNKLKHLLHPAKIGHGGTLDPLATGVLPIAFGKATRTVDYVMNGKKKYEFKVKFGTQTSTDDVEGQAIAICNKIPTADDIQKVLPDFIGDIAQIPPAYSALKIGGKRACDLVRNGKEITMKPRIIHVDSLILKQVIAPDEMLFEVVCGKGTYVRSLGRDIAQKANTLGHITYLRRTHCGVFDIKDSFLLEKINELWYKGCLQEQLFSLSTVLSDILELAVSEEQAFDLMQGRAFKLEQNLKEGVVYRATNKNELIAFVKSKGGMVQPFKVFKQIK